MTAADASTIAAWIAAADTGVRLRWDGRQVRVAGRSAEVPPSLLAKMRVQKAGLAELLTGDRCRWCGGAIDWSRPGSIAFADGTGAHLRCYETAER